jgi:prepilin-type N-terminal cleavage/methylation domain-containing protein
MNTKPGAQNRITSLKKRRGFTLVELLVATVVTLMLGMVVVTAYNTCMQSYYRTEKQLQALAAFRNVTDRLEREVSSIVFKAAMYPHPLIAHLNSSTGNHRRFAWMTRIKYLHADAMLNSDSYAWTIWGRFNPADYYYPGYELPWPTVPTNIPANGYWPYGFSYAPLTVTNAADWWKADNAGKSLYRINFRPRYMGYYSTSDGMTIDRTEWYFNPPEEKRQWADGLDNDHDDPDGDSGWRILYDDRGSLMYRKEYDENLVWQEWNVAAGSPNEYADLYHGPYSRATFPPGDLDGSGELEASELPAHLGGTGSNDELDGPVTNWDADENGTVDNDDLIDTGTVIGEGFSELRFAYLYKLGTSDVFKYADWWPWDNNSDPTDANTLDPNMPKTNPAECFTSGTTVYDAGYQTTRDVDGPHQFDISYFSLPMAISAKMTFKVGQNNYVYEKVVYMHASRWLKYLNP